MSLRSGRNVQTTLGGGLSAALLGVCAAVGQVEKPSPPPVPERLSEALGSWPGVIFTGEHDPNVPTVEQVVGFRAGERPADHDEILRCFQAWERTSDRVKLAPYATTYEGRESFYAIITSPRNMARLEEIKQGLAKLADPRDTPQREAQQLIRELPATAWLAFSIHGDELSGADGALALAHHLASSQEQEVRELLDNVVVLIDPHQNPDGRDRYIQMLREHRGAIPNTDHQSLLHGGYWPAGRTNHYYFDLNRDWIFGVHPETRGRIRASQQWKPLLFVDAHEMGPLDTYLFSPARAPINPHFPPTTKTWARVFAEDQARAFDERRWLYYTGEWNDNWYPGYTDAWGGFRGAVPILYEQAGVDLFGIKQENGVTLTYREAVAHQATSAWANLRTLAAHRQELLRDFHEQRRLVLGPDSPYRGRVWAVAPTGNDARMAQLADLLALQGFEALTLRSPMRIERGVDRFGRDASGATLPAGTILIPNAQPEGRLLAAMFQFDPRMTSEFLRTERRELVRSGASLMYDITAWSIPLLFDLEAYELTDARIPDDAQPLTGPVERQGGLVDAEGAVAYIVDGRSDATPIAAGRLLEAGVQVRVALAPFRLEGRDYPRGSLVATMQDNRLTPLFSWKKTLDSVCRELGLAAQAVRTGLEVDPELPDLGGGNFQLLRRPRVALVTRGRTSANSMGAIWHLLDQRMGLPVSLIDADRLAGTDLRAYNTLIVPSGFGPIPEEALSRIEDWTRAGGTLIAVGGAAAQLAGADEPFVRARTLETAAQKLEDYARAVLLELAAHETSVDEEALWSHEGAREAAAPWQGMPDPPSKEDFDAQDAWRRRFMPQGALLACRADVTHWLTFGLSSERSNLPPAGASAVYRDQSPAPMTALYNSSVALMAKDGVAAPVRLGVVIDSDQEAEGFTQLGWSALPATKTLLLRASGLLWPEAGQRLANTALVTQERVGRGQAILFASDPAFRGAAWGTTRLLMNAVVYGPGLGASSPVEP